MKILFKIKIDYWNGPEKCFDRLFLVNKNIRIDVIKKICPKNCCADKFYSNCIFKPKTLVVICKMLLFSYLRWWQFTEYIFFFPFHNLLLLIFIFISKLKMKCWHCWINMYGWKKGRVFIWDIFLLFVCQLLCT